jgi:hypothetical protein
VADCNGLLTRQDNILIVGSNPILRVLKGYGPVARTGGFDPLDPGSNPGAPTLHN